MDIIFNIIYRVFNLSDDPYYCGLRARVPNFVKNQKPSGRSGKESTVVPPPPGVTGKRMSVAKMQQHPAAMAAVQHNQLPPPHHPHHAQMLHHSASYQAIHPLYQQQLQAQQQQQHMMYHAKSYESGIGMYGNYVLESFPNRYHHYLRAMHVSPDTNNNINNNNDNDDQQNEDNHDLTNKTDPTTGKKTNNNNKHQHHRTKTAAIAANRVYSDLTAHQQQQSQSQIHSSHTSSRIHNTLINSNSAHRHHHHHLKTTSVNIASNHTKNPLYVSANPTNHQLYGYHTRPNDSRALYDHVPRPRCVTCQCNCSALAPHGLQRWGSESDIVSIHHCPEDYSIDSIDHLARSYPNPMGAFYAPRVIPNRGGIHMPVYPFYQNHYCHQPPQLMSPNPYSTYYGGSEDIEDANVSYRLRKTASNESFFSYPIDTVLATTPPPPIPPPARLPQVALGRRFKPRGAPAAEKQRVHASKDSGRDSSSEQRSIYTGSAAGVGEPLVDDYSESLYGFFQQRKNSKDLRAEYVLKA